jgi:carbon monoxide dehydrogenase subunit G
VREKLEVLAWSELIADVHSFFNRGEYRAGVPAKTFTASASTTASVGAVWDRLQVPETWEGISGVDSVFEPRHDEDGQLVGFKFHSTAVGRQYEGTATPGAREHQSSLTWDIATSEIKGRLRAELHPLDTGTRIDVTMHVESVSMMASFGFRFVTAAISRGFSETVAAFASGMDS